MKESLIKAVRETTRGIQKLALRKGKKSKGAAEISKDNIVAGKRDAGKRVSFQDAPDNALATDDQMIDDIINANDKFEAAIALQPEANPNHLSSSLC